MMFEKIRLLIISLFVSLGIMNSQGVQLSQNNSPLPSAKTEILETANPAPSLIVSPKPTTIPLALSPWQVKSTNFNCIQTIASMRQEEKLLCADIEWNYRSWAACSNQAAQDLAWTQVLAKYNVSEASLTALNGKLEKDPTFKEQNDLLWQVMGPIRQQCLKSLGR